jgi:hypothetical protein
MACSIICVRLGGYGSVRPVAYATNLTCGPLFLAAPHRCLAALPKAIDLTFMDLVSR